MVSLCITFSAGSLGFWCLLKDNFLAFSVFSVLFLKWHPEGDPELHLFKTTSKRNVGLVSSAPLPGHPPSQSDFGRPKCFHIRWGILRVDACCSLKWRVDGKSTFSDAWGWLWKLDRPASLIGNHLTDVKTHRKNTLLTQWKHNKTRQICHC